MMGLRIFDSGSYRESIAIDRVGSFAHTFGGSCQEFGINVFTQLSAFRLLDDLIRTVYRGPKGNLFRPQSHFFDRMLRRPFVKMSRQRLDGCHLLFRLDLTDECLGIHMPNLRFLPLVYGFHYASILGEITYRPVSDDAIDVLEPLKPVYAPEFPRKHFPSSFPMRHISFESRSVDITIAKEALDYQGVFGMDQLSPAEMMAAIEIAKSTGAVNFNDRPDPCWDDKMILVAMGHSPFAQSTPSRYCTNPACSVPLDTELTRMFDSPVRMKSKRVIALYQCEPGDGINFGQIIFQHCSYCHEISVRNQCD